MKQFKSMGQYFTPQFVAEFMVDLISVKPPVTVLEPAAGKGIFIKVITERFQNTKVVGVEIDPKIPNRLNHPIIYRDFFDFPVSQKFSVVIGNPPYVRWKHQSQDKRKALLERSFWGKRMNGLTDMLQPFIFKSVDHLEADGELIFITPKFWQQTIHSAPLREFLLSKGQLELVIDFNEKVIFPTASLNLIIFKFVKNSTTDLIKHVRFKTKGRLTPDDLRQVSDALIELDSIPKDEILENKLMKAFWDESPSTSNKWTFYPFLFKEQITQIKKSCTYSPVVECQQGNKSVHFPLTQLYSKEDLVQLAINKKKFQKTVFNGRTYFVNRAIKGLDSYVRPSTHNKPLPQLIRPVRLGDIAEIGNGMVSGLDKAFQRVPGFKLLPHEEIYVIKVLKARALNRFFAGQATEYIYIGPHSFLEEEKLRADLPNLYQMFSPFKDRLAKRWTPHPLPWWVWAFPRNKKLLERNTKKIFVPCKERIDKRKYVRFAYDDQGYYATQDVTVVVKDAWVRESYEYLVAYLNSNHIFQYLENEGLRRGGVLEFSEKPLAEIPVRLIDWGNPEEVEIHDRISNLVTKIRKKHSLGIIEELKPVLDRFFAQLLDRN